MKLKANVIAPEKLTEIPPGSLIMVGEKLDPNSRWDDSEEPSLWVVIGSEKALLLSKSFPNSETEDLDWFTPWKVTLIGKLTEIDENLQESE